MSTETGADAARVGMAASGAGVVGPRPAAPLLGREAELALLLEFLERRSSALVTVTGPGGVGKTVLAWHAVSRFQARVEHGVAVVPLASLSDPEFVLPAIASALGLGGPGLELTFERVRSYVAGRRLVLLLDNFEHVLSAATVVAELMREAPGLKVIVTSRTRLHVSGEQELPLGMLPAPRWPAASVAEARANPAVALFLHRARQLKPDFALNDDNVQQVAAICARLDGWPLAIELAAGRSKLLPPVQLLERLDRQLTVLAGGPTDHPERHRALRSTLDWSYQLLDVGDRSLLAALSVFHGGATLETIEAVCTADDFDALTALTHLVDHSMVSHEGGRFDMLDPVREYAGELLQRSGTRAAMSMRHATCFLALAEEAEPRLRGPDMRAWLGRLRGELDNLRGALAWCLQNGEPILAMRMAAALSRPWWLWGLASEGRRWIETALAAAGDRAGPLDRAKALTALATMVFRMLDMAQAEALFGQALALYTEAASESDVAKLLIDVGTSRYYQGRHHDWQEPMARSIALSRRVGDRATEARALVSQGTLFAGLGEHAEARAPLEEGLLLARQLGDGLLTLAAVGNLGWMALHAGRLEDARTLIGEAVQLGRDIGDRSSYAINQANLGEIARRNRDFGAARDHFVESIVEAEATANLRVIATSLDDAALLCMDAELPEAAAGLLAAAEERRRGLGLARDQVNRVLVDACRERAASILGAAGMARAEAKGRMLTVGQAVEVLRQVATVHDGDAPPAAPKVALTVREREVLQLLAQGLTDRAIAQRLGIQTSTASKHLANLLAKTSQRNRMGLVLWAVEQGLVTG